MTTICRRRKKAALALAKEVAVSRASAETGVRAMIGKTAMTAAALAGTVTINGATTGAITTTADAAQSRKSVADAINAISDQTGVRAIDTGDDNAGLRLEAADVRNIITNVTTLTVAATGLKVGGRSGTFSLVSDNGAAIAIGTTDSGRLSRAGLAVGSYQGGVSTVSSDARAVVTTATAKLLNNGDLAINGVAIYSAVSAIVIANAINAGIALTSVTAKANALTIDGATTSVIAASATATSVINGFGMDIALDQNDSAQGTRASVAREINTFAGLTGVEAVENGRGGLSLTEGDGLNVSVWFDND